MEFKSLQKYDDAGYYAGQCTFQVLEGVFAPERTTETPLPEGADLEANFYKWNGQSWDAEKKPTCAADLIGVAVSHQSQTSHDQEMRSLVQRFGTEEGYRIRNRSNDLSWEIEKIPDLTPEELAEKELQAAKSERADAVSKITVEVDGMTFDGDETAQTRMGRTIAAAVALGVDIDTYTQTWVLADNTVAEPTIKQLAQALKLAGEAQTALWTVPYEDAAS